VTLKETLAAFQESLFGDSLDDLPGSRPSTGSALLEEAKAKAAALKQGGCVDGKARSPSRGREARRSESSRPKWRIQTAPSVDGEFRRCCRVHVPLLAALNTGIVSYTLEVRKHAVDVGAGFAEVLRTTKAL